MTAALRHRVFRLASAAYRRLPAPVHRALVARRGFPEPLLVDRPRGSRVVVLAPHPDDELIGCGGTVAKHIDAGDDVTVVLVTSGEATSGLRPLPPEERGPHREAEARKAAATFGLPDERLRLLRAPDGGVAADPHLPARLAAVLDECRPDLVYAPWPVDANRDHRATAAALGGWLAGHRSSNGRLVALYEVWTPLAPTHLVDITATLERKLEALACYESALATVDYRHTATGLAAYRSSQGLGGHGYAEAFCILDPVAYAALIAAIT